jgi:hypothetical protein
MHLHTPNPIERNNAESDMAHTADIAKMFWKLDVK